MSDQPCHSALFPTCCIEYLANHDMLSAAFDLTATPTMYFNATRTHALPVKALGGEYAGMMSRKMALKVL